MEELYISKYNISNGGWGIPLACHRASSIRKFVLTISVAFATCTCYLTFVGDRVRFWTNIWRGSFSFCDRFPFLYKIVPNHDSTMA